MTMNKWFKEHVHSSSKFKYQLQMQTFLELASFCQELTQTVCQKKKIMNMRFYMLYCMQIMRTKKPLSLRALKIWINLINVHLTTICWKRLKLDHLSCSFVPKLGTLCLKWVSEIISRHIMYMSVSIAVHWS